MVSYEGLRSAMKNKKYSNPKSQVSGRGWLLKRGGAGSEVRRGEFAGRMGQVDEHGRGHRKGFGWRDKIDLFMAESGIDCRQAGRH